MFEDINKQIAELKAGHKRYLKVSKIIEILQNDKKKVKIKLSELKDNLDKENRDVEKFEGVNLTTLFYKLFGSYDVKLSVEKQEAFTALLQYNQCVTELENIESEIRSKISEKIKYQDYEHRLKETYDKKIDLLKSSEISDYNEVFEITKKVSDCKAKLKEIDEALDAGDLAVKAIKEVSQKLKSAQGWGIYDMVGGGLISGVVKHSYINDAKRQSEQVHTYLRMFKNELLDINIEESININIDGFDKFIDYFFDGLISDFFVQSKINSAKDNVDRVYNQVSNIVDRLYCLKDEEEVKFNQYNKAMVSILDS